MVRPSGVGLAESDDVAPVCRVIPEDVVDLSEGVEHGASCYLRLRDDVVVQC